MSLSGVETKSDIKKIRRRLKAKDYTENILISILPVIGFFIFGAFPMVMSLIMSFFEMKDPDFVQATFVGLENYKTMFSFGVGGHGRDLLYTFSNIAIYTLNVFIGLAIAIYVSYQLNKIYVFRRLLRTIFFIPTVCSITVVTIVFKMFLGEYSGVFNQVLASLGFESVAWLTGSPLLFNISMIIVSVWSGLGYGIVLLQAAFAGVDESYAEAAAIDGATAGQIFWKITFHAITPTLGYLLTMRLIGSLQQMGTYYQFGNGVIGIQQWPDSALYTFNTPVTYIYSMFHDWANSYGFGIASATAWILAVVIFIITRINFRLQEKWVSYDF